MFTKSLASEWAQHGIRVNTIAPGYMKTELTKDYFAQGGDMIDTWMKLTSSMYQSYLHLGQNNL